MTASAERPWLTRHPECPIGAGNRTGYCYHLCRCPWCRRGNALYFRWRRGLSLDLPLPGELGEQLTLWAV